jgi:hypothetical protein
LHEVDIKKISKAEREMRRHGRVPTPDKIAEDLSLGFLVSLPGSFNRKSRSPLRYSRPVTLALSVAFAHDPVVLAAGMPVMWMPIVGKGERVMRVRLGRAGRRRQFCIGHIGSAKSRADMKRAA